jgi:molybdopterin synthase sulfur carrier subunit
VATVLFFGPARDAAGVRRASVEGQDVDEVVSAAVDRFGPALRELLPTCRVWVNGEPATGDEPLGTDDEVAVLPPVSGG